MSERMAKILKERQIKKKTIKYLAQQLTDNQLKSNSYFSQILVEDNFNQVNSSVCRKTENENGC